MSWKDKLLMGSDVQKANTQKEDDFKLLEGDAKKEIVDGIPAITFTERVHQFISKPIWGTKRGFASH
ncbi:hypothetical protein PVK06_021800 [Gossypium arboreum]|uniref:Uncharacterized protein n=1 Tax=Gossypium arboreum TaxID=29729 RepID=A0ABR0PR00_GOSAR|nr:hypothetical protein PVK06_021800 [Gossypium arboreum]